MENDHSSIIQKGIEAYKESMVGAIIRPEVGNRVATQDAIRRYANGTGDQNPLWLSEDYAKKSVHGDLIAPPFFLTAVSEGQAIIGLPGMVTTFVGAEWEWHRVIKRNDSFSVTNLLLNLKDKSRQEGQNRYLQSGIISYINQNSEVSGTCKWNVMRTEVKLAGKSRDQKTTGSEDEQPQITTYQYTPEELASIFKTIDNEEIRGKKTRYWEDVSVGDEIRPVVKGPLSLSDMIAYASGTGWHRISLAHETKLSLLRKKPGLAYTDPRTLAPEPIANSHFQDLAASFLMGSPIAIDLGYQRICWFGHLVTNWMSDLGFLRKLSCRLEEFVRFGDTNWCKGRVSRCYVEDDIHMVELDLFLENQRGEKTASATAIVELPSKSRVLNYEG